MKGLVNMPSSLLSLEEGLAAPCFLSVLASR